MNTLLFLIERKCFRRATSKMRQALS